MLRVIDVQCLERIASVQKLKLRLWIFHSAGLPVDAP